MQPYTHQVQYYETDKMQITHHSNYIRFMEEARVSFMEQTGFGYKAMEDGGVVSPVISISCEYRKSTTFGDKIIIDIKVLKLNGVKLELGYTMTCDGQVVCNATSGHCFLDSEGKLVNIKKTLPEFYAALESLMKESKM